MEDYPIYYYSEFDATGAEIRRIDIYLSGQTLYADQSNQEGVDESWLSDTTYQEVMESNLDDEFTTIDIAADEFNKLRLSSGKS